MQTSASRGQSAAPKLVGIGAALAAFAIALAVMISPSSETTPQQTASSAASKNCYVVQRKLLVASTVESGGTIRFRSGNWVSPPMVLTTQPQPIVFPLPRPQTEPVKELITIEGNATGLVLTSDVTEFRTVYDSILGSSPLQLNWMPIKTC